MKPGCTISFNAPVWMTITFTILKSTGYLAWSWWWVFAPIWIPLAVILLVIFGWIALVVIAEVVKARHKRRIWK